MKADLSPSLRGALELCFGPEVEDAPAFRAALAVQREVEVEGAAALEAGAKSLVLSYVVHGCPAGQSAPLGWEVEQDKHLFRIRTLGFTE